MSEASSKPDGVIGAFYGPNAGYLVELYEQYRQHPESVDSATRTILEAMTREELQQLLNPGAVATGAGATTSPPAVEKVVKAVQLARTIREFGHLQAASDPMGVSERQVVDDPELVGLSDEDLAGLPSSVVWPNGFRTEANAWEAIRYLRKAYSGPVGYDFSHVHNFEERDWLRFRVESGELFQPLPPDEQRDLLFRLTEVETFERHLHTTYAGQKRFSIEGTDTLVPMLDALVAQAVKAGVREVAVGMAHRGRLNVLAHVLGKPYAKIFSEFHSAVNKDMVPSEGSRGINVGWTGDVKYHLGAHKLLHEGNLVEVRLTLANNPSHLEFVNPVIEGTTRAAQEDTRVPGLPKQSLDSAIAVAIHGDAAFPGEGVVAETLNLSRLPGYQTGGTVHIIMNNGLGFTTEPDAGRSTLYASDLAKGFEIPVVHVNADEPEACLAAVRLAYEYRQRFHKDFLIDLIGYRRWGHNEGDEPLYTQPVLYKKIAQHPTVRALYADTLAAGGVVAPEDAQRMVKDVQTRLQEAKEEALSQEAVEEDVTSWHDALMALAEPTAVDQATLQTLSDQLLSWPSDFHPNPKLERQLKRRAEGLSKPKSIDWGFAESLAFGTIIMDGTPIRMSGQDTERGTFSQRHLVLHDTSDGATYTPLQHLPSAQASFAVYNSPLSESAVMGFEYGYSVEAPTTFVVWEAQFGDFANAGQVIIDQFIAAGRSKWKERSGLVLLLPHGYEGQGPEHSSGRLERFLQLAGDHNFRVVNATTSAQYFHLLRQQARLIQRDPRPLIVMTPKSLLRHPLAASSLTDLVEGHFSSVMEDQVDDANQVERVVLLSGKVVVDLMSAMATTSHHHVAMVRVEQLYPFPESEVQSVFGRYPNLKEVAWLQEEPQNMGAWHYIEPKLRTILPREVSLRYMGRPDRGATAEGFPDMHAQEQARMVQEALSEIKVSARGGRR